jgi:DNA-binding LacI/PurR family transcriptional regulator
MPTEILCSDSNQNVPRQEFSSGGYNQSYAGGDGGPSLSSVFQPGYQLGVKAASMLHRVKGAQSPPIHSVLQTQLKFRESAFPDPLQRITRRRVHSGPCEVASANV